jgi:lysophospholipase L1-like esterase
MRKTLLFSKGEKFNFATTGATTSQLLKQAKRFIKSTNDSEYKMLFIWIGCNDVFGKSISMLQQTFERDVVKVIELLKHPKLLIYILPLPDLTHLKANVSIIQKTRFVNEMIEKIARDTGIIFIPIPTERIPSSSQKDLISSIDNVHPSFVAQQLFAKAIWNSLTLHGTVLKTFSDTQTITLRQVTNEPYKHPVY